MVSFKLPVFLLIASIVSHFSSSLVCASLGEGKHRTIVKYEFKKLNTSSIVSAQPAGSSNTDDFGTIRLVKNTLRDNTTDLDGEVGKIVGVVNSLGEGLTYVTLDFFFNTNSMRWNGTIGVQGLLENDTGELEVVGGTNAFRYAEGYCATTFESSDGSVNIYKHTLKVKF